MSRMLRSTICLFFPLVFSVSASTGATAFEERRAVLHDRIRAFFDRQIGDIDGYVSAVSEECAMFPEGTLFPYVLPALAYGNSALKDPNSRSYSLNAMKVLIRPAIVALQNKIDEPILDLESYGDRATEIGQINLALSLYAYLGGDDEELLELNGHFSALLFQALRKSEGRPLRSYPYLTWHFDTMPCVVSLLLIEPENQEYRKLADQYLDWIASEGLDSRTGLPYGESNSGLPRGCDLSLRLPLIHHFAPEIATAYYQKYVEWHWSSFGFREWPIGQHAGIDIDSGPIFNGVGLSATGNGVAATLAFKDQERAHILLSLLEQRDMWVALYHSNQQLKQRLQQEFEKKFAPINTEYFTGFLYGDCALFYMLTWEDYALVGANQMQ